MCITCMMIRYSRSNGSSVQIAGGRKRFSARWWSPGLNSKRRAPLISLGKCSRLFADFTSADLQLDT
jgi:hypothetical protein